MSDKAHPDLHDEGHSHAKKASPKMREVAVDKLKLGDLEAPPNNPYPFNHLHVHTEFSLLDGLSKIDKLVDRAYKLGMRALAISDHGTMYGVMQFYRACIAKGIKPIIGCEAYLAKGNMRVHDATEKQPYHLLLLARNFTGYKNLLKIATTAQLEGFYSRPRVDRDYLAAHAEGIIATSGCLAAEIPRMVQDGREDEARRTIGWYQDVFGKDNFFLELQSHDIPELNTLNKWLYENAGYANVPFLATNDVHYVLNTDADAHDTLMCIQTNSLKSDEKRMKMTDASYYLRSGEEMWQIFGSEIPSALTNTILVAEMVEPFNLDKQGYHLPIFPVPTGFDASGYLRHLAMKGLEWRYGDQAYSEYVQQRIEYELGIINRMGFDTYFLIVWDLCQFARHADIWWNVRGSAAGSVVAYSLGITNIDPLHNNLIFERFLNPGRVTMPDIDMDFPDDRRSEMIEYAKHKYGDERVAAIITFGTMKARAAIKDVARTLAMPLPKVAELTSLIPNIPSKPVTIADCLGFNDDPNAEDEEKKLVPQLRERYDSDPEVRSVLNTALTVEGVARNAGTHAAGVIIGDQPLVEYLPLHRPMGESVLAQMTQFGMEICESIGLLKVDFLGLSTLTIMRRACELIEKYHGIRYTMDNIPYRPDPNDPELTRKVNKLFDLIGSGETTGVFQLESGGMRKMLKGMKPRTFEHIVAAISLYRPGPMDLIPTYIDRMHGRVDVEYHHPKLEPILSETYGICISGDSQVIEARTGKRYRIDEIADFVPDFYVQGVDENLKPAIGQVIHWVDNGVKPVYQITLQNGATLKATRDHQFLSESGWKQLGELSPGDFIATPLHLLEPSQPMSFSREKLRILAYLIADGSLASGSSVDFVNKEQRLVDEYLRCLTVFDDYAPVFTPQSRGVTRVSVRSNQARQAVTDLLRWMRDLGMKYDVRNHAYPKGVRSQEKSIPEFVFTLSNADIAFFLGSLWDCDGFVGEKMCHYKTISKQLAYDVQTLLLRLGLASTIYTSAYTSSRGECTAYQVTLYDTAQFLANVGTHMLTEKRLVKTNGKSHAQTIARQIFVDEAQQITHLSAKAFHEQYGVDSQHFYKLKHGNQRVSAYVVREAANQIPLPETLRLTNTDWREIASIEPCGEERVYDITVAGLHNFVASNIIVHNCVYQEQIQQIAASLFGYSLGDADLMRRAVSKKKKKDLDKHKAIFMEKGPQYGVSAEVAAEIFADIEFFAAYGFNKCLVGSTELVDAVTGRLIRLEDLATGRAYLEQTISCDTTTLKLQTSAVASVWQNGVKPVYRLTTALGHQIEATDNHPFYSFEGWRLLGSLRVGERIAVPRHLPVEGKNKWEEYQAIVLGHLLAEGNLCHPHGLYYSTSEEDQWQDFVANAECFQNTATSTHRCHGTTHDVYIRRADNKNPSGLTLWIDSLGLRFKDSYSKFIPDEVFTLENDQIALLIARMWEGDGNVDTTHRFVYYATSSERMAGQLQHLLLRFSIVSRLRKVRFAYKDGRYGYQLHVTGNENLRTFQKHIAKHFIGKTRIESLNRMILEAPRTVAVKDSIPLQVREIVRRKKDARAITWKTVESEAKVCKSEFQRTAKGKKNGFARSTIGLIAEYFNSDELWRHANSDIYWDEITQIEYVGEQPTYDLTIPDTHNFIANNIIVHNSHAADYAVLTCQTAYLKAHYPHEYYCALLSVQRHNTADVTLFTADCRRQGIPILPPDVNTSHMDFVIEALESGQRGIRFGLSAIKTVGDRVVEAILAARNADGPFTSLTDFARRVDGRIIGKKALESMAKVGAFDSLTDGDRDVAIAVIERLHTFSANYHKRRESGQYDMFGSTQDDGFEIPVVPPEKRLRRPELLAIEKELVGLYLSPHPLYAHINELQQEYPNFTYSRDINESVDSDADADDSGESSGNTRRNEDPVVVAGLVSNIQTMVTKRGDEMGKFTLEDVAGTIECVLFPKTWTRCKDLLKPEALVIVFGKADTSRGAPQVLVDTVSSNFTLHQAADEVGSVPKATAAASAAKGNGEFRLPQAAPPQEVPSLVDRHEGEPSVETEEYALPPEEGYFEPEMHEPNLDTLPDWLRDEPPPQPQPTPTSRSVSNGKPANGKNGNGNGHIPKRLTTETPAYKPSDAPARMITLYVQSQGTEADARKLEIIATKLKSFPGKDRYRVRLIQGKKRYWIEFQDTTDFDSVAQFLIDKVGEENVKVSALDEAE